MNIFYFILVLYITTEFNEAITTRGSRNLWRTDFPHYLPRYEERDQYRDYSHVSFYDRRPVPISIDDIYREAERYNLNYNPRFHRQNRWSFVNKDPNERNTEAFFISGDKNQQYGHGHRNDNSPGAENIQDRNPNRDTRQTLYSPEPHLPWEDALRHSVYLTLIRDKIDNILTNNRRPNAQSLDQDQNGKDVYESTDIDLWRNIKKAPFKSNGKEKGPVFGDIAILSRGKLIESANGFEFIEDESFKECIECHLYSAKPNEYEAEKILMANCDDPSCINQAIRALWTVRRIRHRNSDENGPKFMYELMFSIASPRAGHTELDYNVPSETFTINENDKDIQKNNIDEKRNKVVFVDEKRHDYKASDNKINDRNSIKQYDSNLNNDEKLLNTGEYVNTKILNPSSDPRIMHVYDENNDNNKYKSNTPIITHLHHHYYLNDKGIPMLKPSIKYDNENHFEAYIPNMGDVETVTEMNPRTIISNKKGISETTYVNNVKLPETHSSITYPTTKSNSYTKLSKSSSTIPKFNKSKKKSDVATKQFIPSPKDERIVYSELDPLYTSTTPTTKTHAPIVHFDKPTINDLKLARHPKYYSIKNNDETIEDEMTTLLSTQDYEDSVTNPDIGTTVEHMYLPESTTQLNENDQIDQYNTTPEMIHIVYPETTTNVNEHTETPKININNKRLERKPYKVTRRIKQKTFSELLKSQSPRLSTQSYQSTKQPSKDIEVQSTAELQQKIADVSRKFATNKTNNFEPQRTSRRKYQRRYSTWNNKISSSTTLSTTTQKPTTNDILNKTESYFADEINMEQTTDATYDDMQQDNIEDESEKTVTIDRMSTISDSDPYESVQESSKTETIETTTEDIMTIATDSVDEESETTNYSFLLTNKTQHTTEASKLNEDSENEESMFTPLTRKSYVTSISLKLGNKTRPFHPIANKKVMDEVTTSTLKESDETKYTTDTSEYSLKNVTEPYDSSKEKETASEINTSVTTNNSNIDTIEDDVVVAKIVQHSSLHKLKLESNEK